MFHVGNIQSLSVDDVHCTSFVVIISPMYCTLSLDLAVPDALYSAGHGFEVDEVGSFERDCEISAVIGKNVEAIRVEVYRSRCHICKLLRIVTTSESARVEGIRCP